VLETERPSSVQIDVALPLVLFVGSAAEQAIAAAVRDPQSHRLVFLADVSAAIAWLAGSELEPALVVICQTWPDEFSSRDLMRLRGAAPLARFCGLLSSWCEGETRSGRPWPGVWRVYAHQWPQRGARHLAAVGRAPSAWILPPTATAEEQLLKEVDLWIERSGAAKRERAKPQGTIAVLAAAAETGAALADACRSLGYEAIVWRELPVATDLLISAVLWDTSAADATTPATVNRVKLAAGGAPVAALLGFPRPEQIEQARQAGVTAVVSKPFLLADLEWQLAALVGAALVRAGQRAE
jgi:CheY-like chemotaxis protein